MATECVCVLWVDTNLDLWPLTWWSNPLFGVHALDGEHVRTVKDLQLPVSGSSDHSDLCVFREGKWLQLWDRSHYFSNMHIFMSSREYCSVCSNEIHLFLKNFLQKSTFLCAQKMPLFIQYWGTHLMSQQTCTERITEACIRPVSMLCLVV